VCILILLEWDESILRVQVGYLLPIIKGFFVGYRLLLEPLLWFTVKDTNKSVHILSFYFLRVELVHKIG
jgi:hypothetical protein